MDIGSHKDCTHQFLRQGWVSPQGVKSRLTRLHEAIEASVGRKVIDQTCVALTRRVHTRNLRFVQRATVANGDCCQVYKRLQLLQLWQHTENQIKSAGSRKSPEDITMSDITMSDITMSDITMSDITMSDITMSDITMSDITMSDITMSDITMSDITMSDITMNDITMSDITMSDITMSDITMSDITMSDITMSDITMSDNTMSDITMSDNTMSDITMSDNSHLLSKYLH